MPKQFDTFLNSKKSQKQAELILRDLNKKLEQGEILSQEQLRQRLAELLGTVESRGRIVFEAPVSPGQMMVAERLQRFFDELNMDIEILFTEVDATDETLANMANVIDTQLRNLEFNLGQLRSELIERRIKIPPGSGWSKIVRDSFERGYGQLLGRAELPFDLFKDVRTGLVQDGEANPIKADAKIEGVAKKLILPEIEDRVVGFKDAQLNQTASSTPGDLDLGVDIPLYRAIDQSNGTFWSILVANSQPLLGEPTYEVTQVAGPDTGSSLLVDVSGLMDPRHHDYFVQVVSTSGFSYRCLPDLAAQEQARACRWDVGNRCNWDYEQFYSLGCTNNNCARYEARTIAPSGVWGPLEDGFQYETGAQVAFSGAIQPGQTWRVTVKPSGMAGANLELQLDLAQPGSINWFELDPVTNSPFKLNAVEYTRPGTSGRLPITSGVLEVGDRIRLDFPSIEAESVFLSIQQENFTEADFLLRQEQVTRSKVLRMRDQENAPSIDDFYSVGSEHLLASYLPAGPLREMVDARGNDPDKVRGYIYQVGIFNATCGHTSYADTAIAVTRATRVVTPRMFAVQGDLEPAIQYASGIATADINGTLEFSVVRLNYDGNNTLINIEDFPVPRLRGGLIHERLFIDTDREGDLRFAADSISSVEVLSLGRTLTTDEYVVTDSSSPIRRTSIRITRKDVSQTAIVLVKYVPATGVFLNQEKNLMLESNSDNELSLSTVDAIVVADSRAANRDIAYSDVHLRIILRRNDPDIFTTPGLRDYQLLISEADPGRFF